MMHPTTFVAYHRGPSSTVQARDAAHFLRAHDKMSAILPGITRMVALQKACAAARPSMFEACTVFQLNADQLVLSTPNTALAAKLKQQLPKLQEFLRTQGWQVNTIRLKVQVIQPSRRMVSSAAPLLPAIATSAFADLGAALENSPRNAALRAAIDNMVRKQRPR